jgi:hypothetical protein
VHTRPTQLLQSVALAARIDSPGLRERMPAHGLATRLSTPGTKSSLPTRLVGSVTSRGDNFGVWKTHFHVLNMRRLDYVPRQDE